MRLLTRLTIVFSAFVFMGPAACGDSQEPGGQAVGSDAGADAGMAAPDTTDAVADAGDTASPGADDTVDADTAPLDTTVEPGPPTLVEIVAPADGANVEQSILVRLEPVGKDELVVDFVTIKVNDVLIRQDTKLPTQFVLDTRQYPPGPLRIEAYAQDGFDNGADTVTIGAFNPQLTFVEVTPPTFEVGNGQVVSIVVDIEGPPAIELAADFSAVDSGYSPGMETAYAIGGGSYAISHVITPNNQVRDGVYRVPITARVNDWVVVYETLDIALRNTPHSPMRVRGGIYVDDKLPTPSANWGVSRPTVTADNDFIVTGGSGGLSASLAGYDAGNIVGVLVGLEGNVGYYQVPVHSTAGTVDLSVFLRTFASFESPPSILPVRVAVRDNAGRVSPYGAHIFNVAAVGSGDVQVSLAWDTATDVDLHVVEPGGCELYYGNRSCSSGGELDLDSNAGCGLDNINNENVFFTEGNAPVGTYTVRVNFWSDCCDCGADYTVTINNCGATEIHQGSFAPNTSTGGGQGSGQIVATFSNTVCQSSIRGRVRYQDRVFDRNGFGALTWKPVRNAVVELRRLSDGEVVATGATDRAGDYEIQFTNDGPPGLIVAVKTKTDLGEGLRDIEVNNHPKFSDLYEVTSLPLVFQPNQEVLIQDIDVTVALNAGAFNIFDVLQRGYDLVRLMTGANLGELNAFWATGTDTTDTFYCSPFFHNEGECTELEALSVQGKDTDRDEFDDMVILKEFFKFALGRLSRDDHPGGTVDGTRDQPNRAWSEGVTTFFAADVTGSRYFVNSRPNGVYLVDDVESGASPFAFGVQGSDTAAMTDNVSPDLIAALLWDLADDAAGAAELEDSVSSLRPAVYDVLFNYLPSDDYIDRGAPGVDISDFLDGWFCRGWGNTNELTQLLAFRGFPYDFAGPTGCQE